MKQTLQLKVSQHLALTPQLAQSIRLLQLSTLELQHEITQALAENPLLEVADDLSPDPSLEQNQVQLGADGQLDAAQVDLETNNPDHIALTVNHSTLQASNDDAQPEMDAEETADSVTRESIEHIHDNWEGDWRDNTGTGLDGDEDPPALQLASPESTLADHLLEQLRLTQASPRDKQLVVWLIDHLNDDGYLIESLDAIFAPLQSDPEYDPDECQAALRLLQSFDPVGVGARTAAECLSLQILAKQPEMESPILGNICLRLVQEHLPLLAQRDYTRLKKVLHVNDDTLRLAHQLIRTLDPFPGARFRRYTEDHIIPDVLVHKLNGHWHVQLNPDVVPKLRINDAYAAVLKGQRGQNGAMASQLVEAKWFLKNIHQRFETILRVSQAIVEHQLAYFEEGETAMQPLVLREIAEQLGLHESTVSRVTSQKYMLTPHGLVELKYFFGSHVSTQTGGQASSTAIRALIKQLVSAEDPHNPISDSQIADSLSQQGIVVARRTVAKYRESLKIPPVNLRKTL